MSELPEYDYDKPFEEEEYDRIFEEISREKNFDILSKVYADLLKRSLENENFDSALLRHIFRRAGGYRIRSLFPSVFENFEKLIPVVREVIIYLNRTINKEVVTRYRQEFLLLFKSYLFFQIPYVNNWLCFLLQNKAFKEVEILENYEGIGSIRNKALIAYKKNDATWVKDLKDKIDVLGPWDKRGVLYSSLLLSKDEMGKWLKAIYPKGDIVDRSLVSYLLSIKPSLDDTLVAI